MSLVHEAVAVVGLLAAAPLAVWAERKVKAWSQMRRGPSWRQPYRDLRRLMSKSSITSNTASPFHHWAPWLAFGCVLATFFVLPLYDHTAGLAGPLALLVVALLLTLQRAIVAAQAYDAGTAFTGLGSSRELFLGGLGEPVFLLLAAALFLESGSLAVPPSPLPWSAPATWLILGALAIAWLAEAARLPFDNPATHLELTMVHEAMILESSGGPLAVYEFVSAMKQAVLAALMLLLIVPFPTHGVLRVALLALAMVLLSGVLAVVESGIAKVRLFRASHLLVMASLLAFLGGVVTYLSVGVA